MDGNESRVKSIHNLVCRTKAVLANCSPVSCARWALGDSRLVVTSHASSLWLAVQLCAEAVSSTSVQMKRLCKGTTLILNLALWFSLAVPGYYRAVVKETTVSYWCLKTFTYISGCDSRRLPLGLTLKSLTEITVLPEQWNPFCLLWSSWASSHKFV